MSIGMFWAVPLIAFSALTVLAQDPPELQEPVASLVPVDQQESKITAAAAAANPRAVAYCPGDCTGFSASTGKLYFTSHYVNEFGPDSASFHRTSKSGVPGSAGLLYEEVGPPVGSFGRPVWANVNGAYYGYFSASRYNNPGLTYEIKRVPLGGGAAITLAYLPGPINSLETDGSHLFWADPTGIRRMPIGGGAIQNLLSVHVATRFNIRLNGTYVYYSLAREIKRIPKAGGASALMVTASDVVTSFYVTGGLFATIFWGEQGGAVRSSGFFGTQTHQLPWGKRAVTSVGFDGTRIMWIDCNQPGNNFCSVKTKTGTGAAVTVASAGVGARNLEWDATSLYWCNTWEILRYVH